MVFRGNSKALVKVRMTKTIRPSLIPVPGLPGRLHLSAMPGQWQMPGGTEGVARDLARIGAAGATVLISLVQAGELPVAPSDFAGLVKAAGLTWLPCPIPDFGVPDAGFEEKWLAADVLGILRAGGTVALHCRAGLGRTGTLAARVLIEAGGLSAADAIAAIRAGHAAGAVETAGQVAYLSGIAARRRG